MLFAGALAVLVVNAAEPETAEAAAGMAPVSAPVGQQVSQEGTLIAVSADSVTARSADGYTQTYRITPHTTVITGAGDQPAATASGFAVNDKVDIVGTIQGDTVLATVVANRAVGHGQAPPMDFITGQARAPGR